MLDSSPVSNIYCLDYFGSNIKIEKQSSLIVRQTRPKASHPLRKIAAVDILHNQYWSTMKGAIRIKQIQYADNLRKADQAPPSFCFITQYIVGARIFHQFALVDKFQRNLSAKNAVIRKPDITHPAATEAPRELITIGDGPEIHQNMVADANRPSRHANLPFGTRAGRRDTRTIANSLDTAKTGASELRLAATNGVLALPWSAQLRTTQASAEPSLRLKSSRNLPTLKFGSHEHSRRTPVGGLFLQPSHAELSAPPCLPSSSP